MGDMVNQSRALSKRDKSKKHERLTTLTIFIGFLANWGTLVTLVFASQMSAPTNGYAVLAISLFFTIVLTWAYLGERISKSARVPRLLQGTKLLFGSVFVLT